MSAVWLLLGLLVMAFIGSMLTSGRAIRGFGLPSGTEYVLLGLALGPSALGIVERSVLTEFDPVTLFGVSWLVFVFGCRFRIIDEQPMSLGGLTAGVVIALLPAVGVAVAMYAYFGRFAEGVNRVVVSAGAGIVASETTRHAARWVTETYSGRGVLSRWLAESAQSGAIVPILGIGVLFAFAPGPARAFALPPSGWALVSITLGVLLGMIVAMLSGRELRAGEGWGVLIGTNSLAIGLAFGLGLSPLTTLFVMGLTLVALAPDRAQLSMLVKKTERLVLLPILVLAGTRAELRLPLALWAAVALILVVRVLTKVLATWAVQLFSPTARRGGALLGLGQVPAGWLTLVVGLALSLRFPGPTGDFLLLCAVALTVFAELIGPAALRVALARAGELEPPSGTSASDSELPRSSAN